MRTGARGKKCEGRAERRRQRKMTAVYNQKNIFVIVCLSFPSVRSTFLSAAVKTENGVLFCLFHFIWLGDETLAKDKTGTFESPIFSCIILSLTWMNVWLGRIRWPHLHLPHLLMDDGWLLGEEALSTKICLLFLWHNYIHLYKVWIYGQYFAKGNKEKIFPFHGRCCFL